MGQRQHHRVLNGQALQDGLVEPILQCHSGDQALGNDLNDIAAEEGK